MKARISALASLVLVILLTLLPTVKAVPGTLDTTFGSGGIATTDVAATTPGVTTSHYSYAVAITIQADGKILAAGGASVPAYPSGTQLGFAVARYNPDGSLDPTFGDPFGTYLLGTSVYTIGGHAFANAIALQTDGKIVLAGGNSTSGTSDGVALIRLLPSGLTDVGFGTHGIITDVIGGPAESVAIQSDNSIVLAGGFASGIFVGRFHSDGTHDGNFGPQGYRFQYLGSQGLTRSVVIQPDGKILVAATVSQKFALIRFDSDGSLDTSFSGGVVMTSPQKSSFSAVGDVVVLPDNKILLAGSSNFENFTMTRYMPDGSLDKSFGTNGTIMARPPMGYCCASMSGRMVVQPNGKIVLAGRVSLSQPCCPDFDQSAVLRFNSDGSFDTSFGIAGWAILGIAGGETIASAIALQTDGKIVVAGNLGVGKFFVARYLGDPSDNTPPTWPTSSGLTLTQINPTSVVLSWSPARDDVAVVGYRIYQNSSLIAIVPGTVYSYVVSGLSAGKPYTFKVEAGDSADNWSSNGPSVSTIQSTSSTPPNNPSFWQANLPWLVLAGVVAGFGVAVFATKPRSPKI